MYYEDDIYKIKYLKDRALFLFNLPWLERVTRWNRISYPGWCENRVVVLQ